MIRSEAKKTSVLVRLAASAALALAILVLAPASASATGCDLLTTCSFSNTSAIFSTNTLHSTGTGLIDPFLRVQMKGYEEGFNTDARQSDTQPGGLSAGICDGRDCDSKTDPNFTRDLLLSTVGTAELNGVDYYTFFLDVNEPGAVNYDKNWITLDQLEIYVGGGTEASTTIEHLTPAANTGGATSGTLTGMTKVYDLDDVSGPPAGDNYININYLVSSGGSGTGDMVAYIPVSLFGTTDSTTYVYLFSQFGCFSGNGNGSNSTKCTSNSGSKYQSQAGFEEWFEKAGGGNTGQGAAVPEPATLLLLGAGLIYGARRRIGGVKKNIR